LERVKVNQAISYPFRSFKGKVIVVLYWVALSSSEAIGLLKLMFALKSSSFVNSLNLFWSQTWAIRRYPAILSSLIVSAELWILLIAFSKTKCCNRWKYCIALPVLRESSTMESISKLFNSGSDSLYRFNKRCPCSS